MTQIKQNLLMGPRKLVEYLPKKYIYFKSLGRRTFGQ